MGPGVTYGCVVDDDMKEVEKNLLDADGLAFLIDDTPQNPDFWPIFKVFTERTRHLRRNHFALADIPVCFFHKSDLHGNQLAPIKVTTYALRQNAFICGPSVTRYFVRGKEVLQNVPIDEACCSFGDHARRRRFAVLQHETNKYSYSPVGYKAG